MMLLFDIDKKVELVRSFYVDGHWYIFVKFVKLLIFMVKAHNVLIYDIHYFIQYIVCRLYKVHCAHNKKGKK